MIHRFTILAPIIAALALIPGAPSSVYAKDQIPVVATFSILGDLVKQVGGKHIALTTLVGADADAHVYEPTPADAAAVGEAKVLFMNGLGFEGWLDRLVKASNFRGTRIVATQDVKAIPFCRDPGCQSHPLQRR